MMRNIYTGFEHVNTSELENMAYRRPHDPLVIELMNRLEDAEDAIAEHARQIEKLKSGETAEKLKDLLYRANQRLEWEHSRAERLREEIDDLEAKTVLQRQREKQKLKLALENPAAFAARQAAKGQTSAWF